MIDRNLMPLSREGMVTVEKTPKYFIADKAPERVHRMSALVKLVIVVCDPVHRLISDYTQIASKKQSKSFENTVVFNATGSIDTSLQMVKTGLYAHYLQKWLTFFPRKQIHIVDGRRLITNPWEELQQSENCIGLKPFIGRSNFYMNDSKGFPCIKKRKDKTPHCFVVSKGRTHPEVQNNVIKKLTSFYKPFNDQFYRLSGMTYQWPSDC